METICQIFKYRFKSCTPVRTSTLPSILWRALTYSLYLPPGADMEQRQSCVGVSLTRQWILINFLSAFLFHSWHPATISEYDLVKKQMHRRLLNCRQTISLKNLRVLFCSLPVPAMVTSCELLQSKNILYLLLYKIFLFAYSPNKCSKLLRSVSWDMNHGRHEPRNRGYISGWAASLILYYLFVLQNS